MPLPQNIAEVAERAPEPERIGSLVPEVEAAESSTPLEEASEAEQAPALMIPVRSATGKYVYDNSFRPTETKATRYQAISYPDDYGTLQNLSNESAEEYQLQDRESGASFFVRAADVRSAREEYKARKAASPKPTQITQIV